MKCPFLVAALLVACTTPTSTPRPPAPDSVSVAIDAALARALPDPAGPGCLAGVAQGDRTIVRVRGLAVIEHGVPIDERTVFDLGSATKQFTAAAVLRLVRDGKLSLDDEARRYLPELPAGITLRHLLHHTSGLRDYGNLFSNIAFVYQETPVQVGDALALIHRQRGVNFAPGAAVLYSNTGYLLLAQIVEKVAGQPFATYLAAQVLAPAGMTGAVVQESYDQVIARRALPYGPVGDVTVMAAANTHALGPAGVFATFADVVAWYRHVAPGDPLTVPGALADGTAIAYAGGLVVQTWRGVPRWSHNGGRGGARVTLLRFPAHDTTIAVMCNHGAIRPDYLAEEIAGVVLGDALAAPAAERADPDAATHAGLYWSASFDDYLEVVDDHGTLLAGEPGEPSVPLVPLGGGVFRTATGDPYRFDGEHLTRRDPIGNPEHFERVAPTAPADLTFFVGTYHSPDIPLTLAIALVDGHLVLRGGAADPMTAPSIQLEAPLRAVAPDAFVVASYTVRFEGDALLLSASRLVRLRFDRVPTPARRP
ncbi:MAG TPA: serine hydrolase domain-containing protein [Kofleriaceae bacterium]|nr:serine hydrolase domain-containing protein [Kofleriaceae bacterium]